MQEMQTPRRGKEHLAQLGSQGVSSWSGEERRRASELVKRVLRLRAGGEQQRHSHHENRSNLASRTEGHSGAMVTGHLLWRGTAGKAPWVAGNETVTQCHRRNPGNTGKGGCKKPQRGRQRWENGVPRRLTPCWSSPESRSREVKLPEHSQNWAGHAHQDEAASPGRTQPGVQEFSQVGPRMPKLPSAAATVPSCATRRCFPGCSSLRGCVCFEPSPC